MRETIEPASPGRGTTARGREATRRPRLRRLVRGLTKSIVAVLVAMLALYGWAWLSLDRSAIARALVWTDADVGDQYRFPSRLIPADKGAGPLPRGREIDLRVTPPRAAGGDLAFDDFLRGTDTRAFLVVHKDRLVYERYFGGSDRHTRQTSFSVAKSFVSTLVGIAIAEGRIKSVEDPVTAYLPELAKRDPRFAQIKLRDLLTMSSGLRYWKTDLPWPWDDDTFTYYGVDLREVALDRTQVERPPGQRWLYTNYNPLLLGMVLERATGMPVSEYMATRLWQPLGAEADATWSLDSERSGFEKMESGLNATPVDFARLGLLFLHHGEWNGRRVVPKGWADAATAADTTTDPADFYQYFWWVDVERPGRFYALGNYGQYVYVAPDADTVVARFGGDWGVDNRDWLATFRDVADRLAHR
ncbi:serine hydrolase domain-containing protein [Streptosporangium sp. NPDC000396]|uniref:serine hydrolase domain-containing protein n=1 Tax=Streptosporangium sp. NPDC000396 TaxID=3366185 RepID=UPI0036826980